MDSILDPWYSPQWFTITVFKNYTWENPLYLWALLGIPVLLLVRWLIKYYLNQKLPVAVVKSDLKSSPLHFLRFVPDLVMALVLGLLIVALARPQRTNEKVEQWTEGIDIIIGYFAVDVN
jgi:Ca-activated chloride channel family protein